MQSQPATHLRILLLADIHGNFPALQAIERYFSGTAFDAIINCGDTVVYAPFPNETIDWLASHEAISILGNTDKKVIKLLKGKTFKKPSKAEKRIMYTSTAEALTAASRDYLRSLTISATLPLPWSERHADPMSGSIGIFHGSPAAPHELLFADSPATRFTELAQAYPYRVIVTGHSHSPYHHRFGHTHFINPGSVGRMFDGNPNAGCAVITIGARTVEVNHFRIAYDVELVARSIMEAGLPPIYVTMFRLGKKLN